MVEISDEMVELGAKAAYEHWQNIPACIASKSWEDRCENLPGSAAFFRALSSKTLSAALSSHAREKEELAALRTYAHEITKVLTGLAGGGSELFAGQIGNMFKADLHFCKMRISDRHSRLHDLLAAEKRRRRSLEQEFKDMFPPRPAEKSDG